MQPNRLKPLAALTAAALLATGCAYTPPRAQIESSVEPQRRLSALTLETARASAPLCAGIRGSIGVDLLNADFLPGNLDELGRALGLDGHLRVIALDPRGPAAAAGITPGTAVLALDGESLTGSGARYDFITGVSEALQANRAVRLDLEQKGGTRTVTLRPVPACDFDGFVLYPKKDAPTYGYSTEGKRPTVFVSLPLFPHLRDDDDLRFLLLAGLAHLELGHGGGLQAKGNLVSSLTGGLGAVFPPALLLILALPQLITSADALGLEGREMAADAVAAILLEENGIPAESLPDRVERLVALNRDDSSGIRMLRGWHPVTPERKAALAKLAAEIRAAKADGSFPEYQRRKVAELRKALGKE